MTSEHKEIYTLTRPSALELVHLDLDALLSSASELRQQAFGRQVELCAIINSRSGRCAMDCAFCAQSAHYATASPIFPLLSEEALAQRIAALSAFPLRHVGLVTSGGYLSREEVESVAQTLEALPARWQGRMCASLGRLDLPSLQRLHRAGLTRFHHNMETSRAFYGRVCTTQSWDQRLDTVQRASSAGLEVCSGGLFGLGESWEDRVDFAFSLREQGISHVPINFLHPHPGTPLGGQPQLSTEEALRIIALLRHILPKAILRVCGGRPLVLGSRQGDIFAAGANALMTGNYLTTAGEAVEEDCRMIEQLGLELTV